MDLEGFLSFYRNPLFKICACCIQLTNGLVGNTLSLVDPGKIILSADKSISVKLRVV